MPLERRLTQEERFWIMSTVPLIPVLIFVIVYYIRVISASFEAAFGYTLVALAFYLFASSGVYEAVSGLKTKRPLLFKVKRWLARTAFGALNILLLYVIWAFLALLLSPVLIVQYIVILSGLVWEFALIALLQNRRTRQLVRKLTQEESQAQT